MEELKYITGRLNLDDSLEILPPEDMFYSRNIVHGRSDGRDTGTIENIRGTSPITMNSLTTTGHVCIGSAVAEELDAFFLFFYHATAANQKIIKVSGGQAYNVLNWSGLDFQSDYLISSAIVVDNTLYFSDGYNEARGVDVSRWASYTSAQLDTLGFTEKDILVGRIPPMYSPYWSKSSLNPDGSTPKTNQIKDYNFQFAYQYLYDNNQYSVLSPYTTLVPQNLSTETYKRVRVVFPLDTGYSVLNLAWTDATLYRVGDVVTSAQKVYKCITQHTSSGSLDVTKFTQIGYCSEVPPITVKEIHVYVRNGNEGQFYLVDMIKRDTTTPTKFERSYYDFYNNVNGLPLADRYLIPFDLVPRKPKSIATGKNKLFLGNYTEGYDTPVAIDLSATLVTTEYDEGVSTSERSRAYKMEYGVEIWDGIVWNRQPPTSTYYCVVRYGQYFKLTVLHGTATPFDPATYAGELVDIESTPTVPVQTPYPFPPWTPGVTEHWNTWITESVEVVVYIGAGSSFTSLIGMKTFTDASSYAVGIVFSDSKTGRKSGVYTNDASKINVPYGQYIYNAQINWELLDHTNIPSWADSYSIVITKNLKKSYFIEYHTQNIVYVTVDALGNKTLEYTYSGNAAYVAIDIAGLITAGKGYEYKEGDRIIFENSGNYLDVPVRGLDGTKVMIDSVYLGTLPSTTPFSNVRFQIYTPLKDTFDQLFYEVGQTYKITVDTGQKRYTVQNGAIEGDCVNVQRSKYYFSTVDSEGIGTINIAGATDEIYRGISIDDNDPNAKWDTSVGRPFVIDNIGEVVKSGYFRWSNNWIKDTKINGLNEFDSGNEDFVPVDNGSIQKLQLAGRDKSDGNVLLAVCSISPVSIYLGEVSMNTAGNTSFLIRTIDVVGDVRSHKFRYGSIHPESVIEYMGSVYWYSHYQKSYVRYDVNGVFPISKYKAVNYFRGQAALVQSSHRVISGFDPHYDQLFVTFEAAPSSEKKTIGFIDDGEERKGWVSFYDFAPSAYVEFKGELYSVLAENVYSHTNSTNYTTFYGTEYGWEVGVSFNRAPDVMKEYKVLAIHMQYPTLSATTWNWTAGDLAITDVDFKAVLTNKNGQSTDILYNEFDVDEYILYGAILKDANSTGGVLQGDDIYSTTLQVNISGKLGSLIQLLFAKLSSVPSKGHILSP